MKPTPRVSLLLIGLLVLQGCDLLCTWRLLTGARPDVYEANPVAAALLQRYGWGSLVLLKCVTTSLIVLTIHLLARRRLATARRLMGGLCLVMAGVVGYSGWLLLRPVDSSFSEMSNLAAEEARLDGFLNGVARFARKREAICLDLLSGRIDLAVAVRRMRDCLAEEIPHLTTRIHTYLPILDRPDEVAAFLYYHSSRLIDLGVCQAGQLQEVQRQVSSTYPTAPLVDHHKQGPCGSFPWGQGRQVSADVQDTGRAS